VRRLAETIHDPDVFIKVCAPPETVQEQLPSHWTIADLGFMMTEARVPAAIPSYPEDYRVESSMSPPVLRVQVVTSNGFIAAKGGVALVGAFAIYDQIETHEAHRRRGLGRLVMHALQESASRQGVGQGVLVATPEGRALYTSLGWQMHSLFTTAVVR
jgi:GNAT superfamily N-acetyltransferase